MKFQKAKLKNMNINTISYDIETIPRQPLTPIEEEYIQKKIDKKFGLDSLDYGIGYVPEDTSKEENSFKNMIMATSPLFGDIICIGIYKTFSDETKAPISGALCVDPNRHLQVELRNGVSYKYVKDEASLLSTFWDLINDFKGTFISYNGLDFDAPFIKIKSAKYGIPPTNRSFLKLHRFAEWPHYDVMQILANWDRMSKVSLEIACEFFGLPSPKQGEVTAKTVYEHFKKGNIDKIAEYCVRDIVQTFNLFDKLRLYGGKTS